MKSSKAPLSPHPLRWVSALFRQPPQSLYRAPALYLGGRQLEIEYFRRIVGFEAGKITLDLPGGRYTIYGQQLKIRSLLDHSMLVEGDFLRIDFQD